MKKNDEGIIMLEFAILLPILLMIIALAVDVGFWMFQLNKLQTGANSSAMAGAYLLPDEVMAEARAFELASLNGYEAEAVVVTVGDNMVEVTISELGVLWFSGMFLKEPLNLKGSAVYSGN